MIEDRKAGTEQPDTVLGRARAEPGLEERTRAGSVEGAGQDSNRWLREKAGPALVAPSDVVPADLAEALGAASTDDLLSWVEQARLQAERPLELEVVVTQSAFDRARSHRAEEALILQGLQRQLVKCPGFGGGLDRWFYAISLDPSCPR